MSDIVSKSIRPKRYKVAEGKKIEVTLETRTGERFVGELRDCSITGLGVYFKGIKPEEVFEITSIIPSLKLVTKEGEYHLGRQVIKYMSTDKDGCLVGLGCVDARVPLDGKLSHNLVIENNFNSPYDFELSSDRFSLANFSDNSSQNVDIFSKCKQFGIFLKDWERSNKFSYNTVRTASMGTRVNLTETRKNGRNDYIIMGSNDYLGLAAHPLVLESVKKAVDKYGFGSTGSALTTGISDLHEDLSEKLAKIFKKEKVLLYNSGYNANVGFITGITREGDLIVSDVLSHASIQDGMLMSKATSRFFKHNNALHLQQVLEEQRHKFAGCIVITEGVFSMDGDVPPLKTIVQTAKHNNCRVMVDEAHSFGVIGNSGLGASEQYGVLDKVDAIMGTFSKICGGIGGFIASDRDTIDWLKYFSRSHMFSVAIPPSTAAAALTALDIFTKNPELLISLKKNIEHFVKGLRRIGYSISEDHQSSVIPVVIGDESKMGIMNSYFKDMGVFVTPIVYPAVSRKNCRFRFTIMANHTISDLDFVLNAIEQAAKIAKVNFSELNSTDSKKEIA